LIPSGAYHGFQFDIQQANIVAYLTTANRKPPRVLGAELGSFLGVLAGFANRDQRCVLSNPDIEQSKLVEAVKRAAGLAYDDLGTLTDRHKKFRK